VCRVPRGAAAKAKSNMPDHLSTVLQRPLHFDEDASNGVAAGEERGPRGLRDILNPVGNSNSSSSVSQSQAPSATAPATATISTPGTPGAAPPRAQSHHSHSSSFSLRSPTTANLTQQDYHAQQTSNPTTGPAAPYSASPPSISVASGPRSILNNPFVTPSAPSLPPPPPPLQAPPLVVSSAASGGAHGTVVVAASPNLQPPPRSPLHAPSTYSYPPTDLRDRDLSLREKPTVSKFYDPTVDADTINVRGSVKRDRSRDRDRDRDSERRVSSSDAGSWRNATQASTPKVRCTARKLWAPQCHPLTAKCSSFSHQSFKPPPPINQLTLSLRFHSLFPPSSIPVCQVFVCLPPRANHGPFDPSTFLPLHFHPPFVIFVTDHHRPLFFILLSPSR